MNLVSETLIVSLFMIFLCALPLLSQGIRKHSKLLFLIGTGALAGLCIFDLLPDVFEMGGQSSLIIIGLVWALYSIAHLFHLDYHDHLESAHRQHGKIESKSKLFFLASMIVHCLASGMLLVLSYGLANKLGRTVFLALLAHKGYESLTVSSVLLETMKSKKRALFAIAAYSLALPVGAILTFLLRAHITQDVALFGTSLAVGTLMGCLIFDFLIPSFTHVKTRRYGLVLIALGFILTQAVMKLF